MKKTELFRQNSNFLSFFFADVVSGIGSGISFIGFNWFILDVTGSSGKVGYFMALSLVSGLCAFPFAGTIADRFNRRDVLITVNLVMGGVITSFSILLYMDSFLFEIVYLVAILNGIGFTLFMPASRGLVQEILYKDDLMDGNSLIEISLQISIFLAAGLTGIIYKYYGFSFILLIDGLSFLLGSFFLMQIRYMPIVIEDKEENFKTQFVNGIKYLRSNSLILFFGIFILIPYAVTIASNVILPAYVSKVLSADSVVFGLAEMGYGFGAFLSGVYISGIVKKESFISVIILLFILSAAALSYLYTNSINGGLYGAYFIFGLANTSLKIILNTLLMEIVPKKQFGRAMAFFMAVSSVFQIICTIGMGELMDKIPTNYGYLILAGIMAVGFCLNISVLPSLFEKRTEEAKNT